VNGPKPTERQHYLAPKSRCWKKVNASSSASSRWTAPWKNADGETDGLDRQHDPQEDIPPYSGIGSTSAGSGGGGAACPFCRLCSLLAGTGWICTRDAERSNGEEESFSPPVEPSEAAGAVAVAAAGATAAAAKAAASRAGEAAAGASTSPAACCSVGDGSSVWGHARTELPGEEALSPRSGSSVACAGAASGTSAKTGAAAAAAFETESRRRWVRCAGVTR